MASQYYNDFMDGEFGAPIHTVIDLDTDNIRHQLTDEGAAAFSAANQDLADIVAGLISESANLAGTTVGVVGDGVFDHTDEVHASVTGASIEAVDYYKETGTDSTSGLISNHDDWTNLPLTPNGGNITVAPAAGGVFAVTPT